MQMRNASTKPIKLAGLSAYCKALSLVVGAACICNCIYQLHACHTLDRHMVHAAGTGVQGRVMPHPMRQQQVLMHQVQGQAMPDS